MPGISADGRVTIKYSLASMQPKRQLNKEQKLSLDATRKQITKINGLSTTSMNGSRTSQKHPLQSLPMHPSPQTIHGRPCRQRSQCQCNKKPELCLCASLKKIIRKINKLTPMEALRVLLRCMRFLLMHTFLPQTIHGCPCGQRQKRNKLLPPLTLIDEKAFETHDNHNQQQNQQPNQQ